jgi:hypothetical protein
VVIHHNTAWWRSQLAKVSPASAPGKPGSLGKEHLMNS